MLYIFKDNKRKGKHNGFETPGNFTVYAKSFVLCGNINTNYPVARKISACDVGNLETELVINSIFQTIFQLFKKKIYSKATVFFKWWNFVFIFKFLEQHHEYKTLVFYLIFIYFES